MIPNSYWGFSFLFVLFKGKGERTDPRSYRGITLSSVLEKLFEFCLSERIRNFIESRDFFDFFQSSAFRPSIEVSTII